MQTIPINSDRLLSDLRELRKIGGVGSGVVRQLSATPIWRLDIG